MTARSLAVHPDVRLWLVDLDEPADRGDLALLSPDEIARAHRFAFDLHRVRFVACRAALRRVLAAELGAAPQSIVFTYGRAGKPAVSPPGGVRAPRFNVSHSDRFALLALTGTGEIGVDIEKRRAIDDITRLARTAFSLREQEELRAVEVDAQLEAFFNGWTRKEAYLKARGEGLTGLADFDVSLAPGSPPALRHVRDRPDEPGRWALTSFTPLAGFTAAICLEVGRPAHGSGPAQSASGTLQGHPADLGAE